MIEALEDCLAAIATVILLQDAGKDINRGAMKEALEEMERKQFGRAAALLREDPPF